MMKGKFFMMGILAFALVFGMMVVGCDDGSDNGGGDPIKVDLSLPSIQNVASFEGSFVSTEAEAKGLIQDATKALADLSDLSSSYSLQSAPQSRSMNRSVSSDSDVEIYENEKVADGAYLTGYYKWSGKMSVADDDRPGYTVGDWYENSIRIKAALDFNAVQKNSCIFNGKYVYDEDGYERLQMTAISPVEKANYKLKYSVENGYALSVSKNGKGIKFVMKLTGKIDTTLNDITENQYDKFWDDDPFNKAFKLSIDVYDNDNVKQYSKTFNDLNAANEYLGFEIDVL